jgi:hypothetical protein
MLMLRRFDALADKLDWWEPLSQAEKVALLKRRCAAAPIAEHEQAYQQSAAGHQNAPRHLHFPQQPQRT